MDKMDGDFSSELASLLFDHEVDDEVVLIDNPLSQAHPNNQENSMLGNSSHVSAKVSRQVQPEHVETGLASGNNLPSSISSQNITPPQANNPSAEISWEEIFGDNNQAQLGWMNANQSLQGSTSQPLINTVPNNANQSLQGSTSQPLINTVPNNNFPSVGSSFDNPFSGAQQPFVQATGMRDVHQEHVEIGSASGNNLPLSFSGQNLTSTPNDTVGERQLDPSPQIAQNIILPRSSSTNSDMITGIPQAYNPTREISWEPPPQPPPREINQAQLGWMNANQSFQQSTNQPPISTVPNNIFPSVASSFNTPVSGAPQSYFPATVERNSEFGGVSLTQLNTQSIIGSQNGLIYSQPMRGPLNLSNSLLADQQLSQNVGSSYFGNNGNRQAFPQMNSTGLGITRGRSQINQQPPTSFPNYQNFPYNTSLTLRPQINQLLASNVQCSSPMLHSSSVPQRSQQLANQQQPLNQGQGNVYFDPQQQRFMVQENPMLIRPQSVLHQPNHVPQPPSFQNSHHSTLLQAPSRLALRGQEQPNQGPISQAVPMMPNMTNLQLNNSLLLNSSMAARGQELPNQASISQAVPTMPNMTNPQVNNSLLLNSSMATRGQELPNQGSISQAVPMMPNTTNLQLNNSLLSDPSLAARGLELPYQGSISQAVPMMPNMTNTQQNNSLLLDPSMPARSSVTYSRPDSSQLNLDMNSATEQLAFTEGQRRGLRSRYEVGESSSAPKRARIDSTGQDRGPQLPISQSQVGRGDNSVNFSRQIRNFVYDPIYETIGLPIDPHLRCFIMKK